MANATVPAAHAPDAARRRYAKQRRRLYINIAIIVAVVAAGATYFVSRRSQPKLPPGLYTGRAERTNLVQNVSATGSVTPQTGAEVKIGSQITGRIKQLHADVGDEIGAGEIIAELDVPDLQANVRQAEATLAVNQARLHEQIAGVAVQETQTRTDIDRARAAFGVARTNLNQAEQTADMQVKTAQASLNQARANQVNSAANYKRLQDLLQKGYVAASDVDSAKAQALVNDALVASAEQNLKLVQQRVATDAASAKDQLKQTQAGLTAALSGPAQNQIKRIQVKEAQNSVAQAQAALAVTRAQYDKAFIRSPIRGTVIQLAQQEGETIAAGLSAPTLIIVADLDRLQVDAFVDETDIGRVRLGQRAAVTVDAYPSTIFEGTVAKIASGSTMQQNVVTYDVTIALKNPGHRLKPDMTATVNITVAERRGTLTVPVDAIKTGVQGPTVTVMSQVKGKPVFRIVRVRSGVSDGERSEILRGDVRDGDTVVLAGQVPGMSQQETGPRFRGLFPGAGGGRTGGGAGARGGGGGGRGG